jgi:hypothetical protein
MQQLVVQLAGIPQPQAIVCAGSQQAEAVGSGVNTCRMRESSVEMMGSSHLSWYAPP